jgi:hypothetical protein
MSEARSFFLILIVFTIVTGGAFLLLVSSERQESYEEAFLFPTYEADSVQGQVIATIERRIAPRRLLAFAMDEHILAVRYLMAENAILGDYDPSFAQSEVLEIICDLREMGLKDMSHEYVLAFRDEDADDRPSVEDAIGIRLEEETIAAIDCTRKGSTRIADIADDFRLIYLEDRKDGN